MLLRLRTLLCFFEDFEKSFVVALDRVVALLVVGVDRALVACYVPVRHVAPAREVLLLPENAVVPVIGLDRLPDAGFQARRLARRGEHVVVERDDVARRRQGVRGHLRSARRSSISLAYLM